MQAAHGAALNLPDSSTAPGLPFRPDLGAAAPDMHAGSKGNTARAPCMQAAYGAAAAAAYEQAGYDHAGMGHRPQLAAEGGYADEQGAYQQGDMVGGAYAQPGQLQV